MYLSNLFDGVIAGASLPAVTIPPIPELPEDTTLLAVCPCCLGAPHGDPDQAQGTSENSNQTGDTRGGSGLVNDKVSLDSFGAGLKMIHIGLKWQPDENGITNVTFAFKSSETPGQTAGFTRFNEAQIKVTLDALAAWSDVANINFIRLGNGLSGDDAYSNNATMLLSNYNDGSSYAAGFAYYPGSIASNSLSGDVFINTNGNSYNTDPTYLGYGGQVLAHEIGHAIGIAHPGAYNAGPGVVLSYAANAEYAEDSRQYSVMSYWEASNTGGSPGRYAAAPLMDDIMAAQLLYGANMTTRTGDTVYGFNSTAERDWFSATSNGVSREVVFAVWDAGGIDTFDFSGYLQNQIIDLRAGAFSSVGGLKGNVAIAIGVMIENAIGGSGDDTIYGNSAGNTLMGGAGNDIIDGGLGSDTAVFSGQRSAYSISEVDGVVTVSGPDGTDTLRHVELLKFADQTYSVAAYSGPLTLSGDWFDNVITGGNQNDVLSGSGGNDTLIGGAGDDILDGGVDNDRLGGGAGINILKGGTGNDTAVYTSAISGVTLDLRVLTAQATGGAGTDTLTSIENVEGSAFADTLTGDAFSNQLLGNAGNDTLSGLEGNDLLQGGTGDDSLDGGDGIDTASYAEVSAGVAVDLRIADAQVTGGAGTDTLISIENLLGSEFADNLTGNADANSLIGGAGNDVLNGGSGNDWLSGGPGDDLLNGGDGTDTADYSDAVSGISVNLALTVAQNTGGAGTDTLTGIDDLVGSRFNDVLVGNSGNNHILAGAGNDRVTPGLGNDYVDGGAGIDTLDFTQASSGIFVFLFFNGIWNTGQGNDTFLNFESANGSQFSDRIYSGRSGGEFLGNDGDDFFGIIVTASGVHLFDGGNGTDTLSITSGSIGITLDLRLTSTQEAGEHIIRMQNIENLTTGGFDDQLFGTSGNNYLVANGGNDVLIGNEGNDILDGGTGSDTLEGGAGNDTAVIGYASGVAAVIRLADGTLRVGAPGGAGVDQLISIEALAYTNGTVSSASIALFDPIEYLASWGDLRAAFGSDTAAATAHYLTAGYFEGRAADAFDALRYIASWGDLIRAFGTNAAAGASHFVASGSAEGRSPVLFDPVSYLAGYGDLIRAFGNNTAAATQHFVNSGFFEGRTDDNFNALAYLAGYGDLIRAFGNNTAAATQHFVSSGFFEGRTDSNFNALAYIAGYGDLIRAFGNNTAAATQHFVNNGFFEGRSVRFDAAQYLANYADLRAAFGNDLQAATLHYINNGFFEGRTYLPLSAEIQPSGKPEVSEPAWTEEAGDATSFDFSGLTGNLDGDMFAGDLAAMGIGRSALSGSLQAGWPGDAFDFGGRLLPDPDRPEITQWDLG